MPRLGQAGERGGLAMKTKAPIIIKVKKKAHEAGGHGGAWKVAYADFVTALMAFFLVMWLVGQDKSVREAVAAYFRDPVAFEKAVAAGLLDGGQRLLEDGSNAPDAGPEDQEALERLATQIRAAISTIPELAAIRDQIEIHMTAEGLRVELQESASTHFFDTGSATMTRQAEELFGTIGRELQKLPNGVLIEGHTDARQYANRVGYTNWELSADRANAVRRVMARSGLREVQLLEVRGYADRQLRNPSDPFDAHNRRVSILVKRSEQPAQQGAAAGTGEAGAARDARETREAGQAGKAGEAGDGRRVGDVGKARAPEVAGEARDARATGEPPEAEAAAEAHTGQRGPAVPAAGSRQPGR